MSHVALGEKSLPTPGLGQLVNSKVQVCEEWHVTIIQFLFN